MDENPQRQLQLRRAGQHITIETEAIDVARFTVREHGRRAWELLIGQAFLDLIDMPTTLPGLCSLVRPGRLLYFPATFDGNTAFQPECDPEFDSAIEASYRQAIDQRVLASISCAVTRTLFPWLGRHFRNFVAEVTLLTLQRRYRVLSCLP